MNDITFDNGGKFTLLILEDFYDDRSEKYESFLESIISDLKKVKNSLKTRSKNGAAHRKEADRIQSAINAMKYLNNKNRRILNNSMINEDNTHDENNFTRSDIKNFLKTYQ